MRILGMIAWIFSVSVLAQQIDAVVVDSGTVPVTLLKNNGAAQFEEVEVGIDLNSTKVARTLALADFDNDGDLDLMVGYREGNAVWLNDGYGNFTNTQQILGASNTVALKTGDFDNDGDIDVFAGNWSAANKIWLNDGQGVFTASDQVFYTTEPAEGESPVADTGDTNAVDVGDVDGDGDLDIFYVDLNSTGATQCWLNDGTGSFTLASERIGLGSYDIFDLALGDLDADGDLDIVFACINDTPNLIFVNDGTGSFSTNGQVLGESRSAKVVLGDVDNDGDLDIFVANSDYHCDGANTVWFNNGDATFTEGAYFGNDPSMSAVLADFDNDGDLDALVANRGSNGWPNRVWVNDGSGAFFDNGQRIGHSQTRGVVAGNIRNLESNAKQRILQVAGLKETGDEFTLYMENPTSTPQSILVDMVNEKGQNLNELALSFSAGEIKRVSMEQYPETALLSLTKNSPVKAYLISENQQVAKEATNYQCNWNFPILSAVKTTINLSNPQSSIATVFLSFENRRRLRPIQIPPGGSFVFDLTKPLLNETRVGIQSNIPIAVQSIQTTPDLPKIFILQESTP